MKKQQDKCKRLRDDLIPRWVHNDIRASGAIGNAQSSSRGWVPPPETSKNRDVFEEPIGTYLWRVSGGGTQLLMRRFGAKVGPRQF